MSTPFQRPLPPLLNGHSARKGLVSSEPSSLPDPGQAEDGPLTDSAPSADEEVLLAARDATFAPESGGLVSAKRPAPDIIYIVSLDGVEYSAAQRKVERHQANVAAGELAPHENMVANTIGFLETLARSLAREAGRLKTELGQLQQFIDTELLPAVWTWKDRLLFTAYTVLLIGLLAADWFNASTLLKTAGIAEFAHSQYAAFCASAGAVVLALALKVLAPSLIEDRKRRCNVLLVPGSLLLAVWIVTMCIAFPGYAANNASLLGGLSDAAGAGVGLPARLAFLPSACCALGIALCAAGIACAAEDLYQRHHGARGVENDQFIDRTKALENVSARLRKTVESLGWHRGEIQRVQALKAQSVEVALALLASRR